MIIRQLHIDGFGKFADYDSPEFKKEIVLFYGRNEAGKSTLRNFITRVLFGYPDRRNKVNLYEPLRGGRHGGFLILDNENGSLKLQRYADASKKPVFTLPEGNEGTLDDLNRLLGYTGEEIYGNIYAFGIEELNDFSVLGSDEVRDRIYSAGTGMGAVSIADIQKQIEGIKGELYTERGKTRVLNALFYTIREIDKELKDAGAEIGSFDALHERLDELDITIAEAEERYRTIAEKQERLDALSKARPDWVSQQDILKTLKDLPEVDFYPENGIEKLERYLEKLEELNAEKEKAKENIATGKALRETLKIDRSLIERGSRIRELSKGEDKYRTVISELPRVRRELEENEDSLRKSLAEIGSGWDAEKLAELNMSIPVKDKIRERKETLAKLENRERDTAKELVEAENELKRISADRKRTADLLGEFSENAVPNEKLISERRSSTVFLRNELPALKERERTQELFSAMSGKSREFSVPATAVFAICSAAIAGIITANITGDTLWGITVFGSAAIVVLTIVTLQHRKYRAFTEGPVPRKESTDIREEILEHARLAGFESIPDLQLVIEQEQKLQDISSALTKLKELERQFEDIEKNKENIATRDMQEREEKEKAAAEWRALLEAQGLDTDLNPESVLEIFTRLETCLVKRDAVHAIRNRVNEMEASARAYEKDVAAVLEKNSLSEGTAAELLANLARELDKNEEALRDAELREKEIASAQAQLDVITEQEKQVNQSLESLYKAGMAADEISFRKNGAVHRQRIEFENSLAQHSKAVLIHAGSMESLKAFTDDLNTFSAGEVEADLRTVTQEMKSVEEDLKRLREEKGGIQGEIARISKLEEISELRFRKSSLIEQADEAARKWAAAAIAGHVLKQAVETYEKERQPDVIKEARQFFNDMTLGNYSSIYAQLSDSSIYLEDSVGKRREIEHLSTGTRQQLYLAVRFGLIRELNGRSAVLPAVFDDIMVNFDHERMEASCRAISTLSKTNQILYFTCHDRTVDTFKELCSDIQVIKL